MAWGLDGVRLSIGWSLALCYHVGFRDPYLRTAVALMSAESGRYTGAWHENIIDGRVDSIDHGLFQINDKWHPDFEPKHFYDPVANAQYAMEMSSGRNFSAWMAYVNGAHLKFMGEVWAVKTRGLWRKKVPRVEATFTWPAYPGGPKLPQSSLGEVPEPP